MNNIIELENTDIFPKSNILINGKYRFTTVEQKILLLVISRLTEDDGVGEPVRVSWEKFGMIPRLDRHERILETCSKLKNRDIILKEGNKITLIGFISGVVIANGEYVEFMLTPQIRELYIDILKNGNFTLIDLESCMNLSSSVSIRMYEILKSLKFRKQPIRIEVERLKWLLDMEGKYDRDFSTFRVFVLDKAQKDLSKYTDIKFDWLPVKVSRFIKYLDITIKDNIKYQSTIIGQLKRQQKILKDNDVNISQISFDDRLQHAQNNYNTLASDEQEGIRKEFDIHLQQTDKTTYQYIMTKYKGIPSNPFDTPDIVDLWVDYLSKPGT